MDHVFEGLSPARLFAFLHEISRLMLLPLCFLNEAYRIAIAACGLTDIDSLRAVRTADGTWVLAGRDY